MSSTELSSIERFDRLEAKIAQLPPVEMELIHHFAPKVYVRELRIPAGTAFTGKIHKTKHMLILAAGEATLYDEANGGTKVIRAPLVCVSEIGAHRAGITHTDCVFVTVHPTTETDLVKIEEEVIQKRENPLLSKKEQYLEH